MFFVAVATKEPRLGGASITNRPSFVGRYLSSAARPMMPPMLWPTRWIVPIRGSASRPASSRANRSACTSSEHCMFQ